MTYNSAIKSIRDGSPRVLPVIPHAKNEEWNDRLGMSGPINGLDSSWTTFGAAQTRSYKNGRLVLTGTGGAITTPNVTGMYKAQPSTPYTVTCEVAIDRHTRYNITRLGFCDSSGTMKLWAFGLFQDTAVDGDEFRRTALFVSRYASVTSQTSSIASIIVVSRSVWLRVTNDGSNCAASWSQTGIEGTYDTFVSESYATALLTPTRFWIGMDPFDTADPVGEFGPVRVT